MLSLVPSVMDSLLFLVNVKFSFSLEDLRMSYYTGIQEVDNQLVILYGFQTKLESISYRRVQKNQPIPNDHWFHRLFSSVIGVENICLKEQKTIPENSIRALRLAVGRINKLFP